MTSSPDPSGPGSAEAAPGGADLSDAVYRAAVVDLLGVLAYGELTAFERLAADVRLAPGLSDKAALAAMATQEFHHFERICAYIGELGTPAETAMEPFVATFDHWHDSTTPADWLEGLMKAYVGDGVAADFYREVAAFLDGRTRDLVVDVLTDTGHIDFAVRRLRQAIAEDRRLAGRLALWGRRLVGEALSQAQLVAVERDALATLFVGTSERAGVGLDGVTRIFSTLTQRHTARMEALGLTA